MILYDFCVNFHVVSFDAKIKLTWTTDSQRFEPEMGSMILDQLKVEIVLYLM